MGSNRYWEIWDTNTVNRLSGNWNDPGSLAVRGSHQELIKKVYNLIDKNSILDVACGMGHIYLLAKSSHDYLGIDTSKAMVNKARELFPADGGKFQFGDVYDLSKLPTFDTVVAVGLLLHLPSSEVPIINLWDKARYCLIFSTWIGLWEKLVETRVGADKALIQRRDTIRHLTKTFDKLDNLCRVEKHRFYNPDSGESNYIFKLSKG